MQIQVKCSCGEGQCKEWAIVELQGVVDPHPSFRDRLQNLQIGRLCRLSSPDQEAEETYTLRVGYHQLTGSKVRLKKPYLVLKRLNHSSASPAAAELDVVGIVRHRILFKTRPTAIIKPRQAVKGKGGSSKLAG